MTGMGDQESGGWRRIEVGGLERFSSSRRVTCIAQGGFTIHELENRNTGSRQRTLLPIRN